MILREIAARFRNRNVILEIDPPLLPGFNCADRTSVRRTIRINLYELVYNVGTIQSRWFAPSNRQKFSDKADLLEKLVHNTTEFRLQLGQIRVRLGSEGLTSLSEDFGVGLSVTIAQSLYDIIPSTVERISDIHGQRPDWKCKTRDDRILVVESKGASSVSTTQRQRPQAILQKRRVAADIQIAALSLLKENANSVVRFVDPPSIIPDLNPEMQNHIFRAGHYASAFSFLGHSALSKYFLQMRKRLTGDITTIEQLRKDATFFEIRNRYSQITFEGVTYAGTFWRMDTTNYMFVGVDVMLVSYEGFLRFEDYDADLEATQNENHYVRFKDGVLLIEIENINVFYSNVDISAIKNYQDSNSISDIDEMTVLSFEKYLVYVLERNGLTVLTNNAANTSYDIAASSESQRYYFQIKHFMRPKRRSDTFELGEVLAEIPNGITVLVTNVDTTGWNLPDGLRVIGRNELKQLVQNPRILLDLIS